MVDSVKKTYAQLTAATDVEDADLLATYRDTGPLKRITASTLKDYFAGESAAIDGSNIDASDATAFRKALKLPDAGYVQSSLTTIVYDNLDRVGLLNGSTATTGQVWSVSGPGGSTARVINGRIYSSGVNGSSNFYASLAYGGEVPRIFGKFAYQRSASSVTTQGPQAVLIIQDASLSLGANVGAAMIHAEFTATGMSLKQRVSNIWTDIANFSYDIVKDGRSEYPAEIFWDRATGTVTVVGPHGLSSTNVISTTGWPALTYGTWQIQNLDPGSAYDPYWASVGMGQKSGGGSAIIEGAASGGDIAIRRSGLSFNSEKSMSFTVSANGYVRILVQQTYGLFFLKGQLRIAAKNAAGASTLAEYDLSLRNSAAPSIDPTYVSTFSTAISKIRGSTDSDECAIDLYFPTAASSAVQVDVLFTGFGALANFGVPLAADPALPALAGSSLELNVTQPDVSVVSGRVSTNAWHTIATASSAWGGYIMAGSVRLTGIRVDDAVGTETAFVVDAKHDSALGDIIVLWNTGYAAITQVRLSRSNGVGLQLDVYTPTAATSPVDIEAVFDGQFTASTITENVSPLPTENREFYLNSVSSTTTDVASIPAGDFATISFTLLGAAVGDEIECWSSADLGTGIVMFATATATNTVRITLRNVTASPIDPASMTYYARRIARGL